MEDRRKRKVHRIEVYEVAHKKMETAGVELQKKKDYSGTLSAQDFNELYNEIVAKELTARGYYDDKYWSEVRLSQGVTFVTQTEEERRNQEKVNAMENKMQCMSALMKQWLAFLTKQFPEEEFINEMQEAILDDEDDSPVEKEVDSDNILEHSIPNVKSQSNEVQPPVQIINATTEDHTSLPTDQTLAKGAHIQSSTHVDKGDAATNMPCDTI